MRLSHTLPVILKSAIAVAIASISVLAGSAPLIDQTSKQSLVAEISGFLDQVEEASSELHPACTILREKIGANKAQPGPVVLGQPGLMGTPITCQRYYETQDSLTSVMIYTDPRFIGRVASGPPPGESVEERTIQGRQVYITPADPNGRSASIMIDASPTAIVFIPVGRGGTLNVAIKIAEQLELSALKGNDEEATRSDNKTNQLYALAEEFRTQLVEHLPSVFVDPDIKLSPVGVAPRCLDVGEFLQDNEDFLYLSFLVGGECIANEPLPIGKPVDIASYKAHFEAPEQGFSGTYTIRGVVELSNQAIISFQASGDQNSALQALKKLPWEDLDKLF